MKAIVAVDSNWAIGLNGNLLERIPEDMKYFKKMTLGKVVVMGRETFYSLPGKEPLKDRKNIVLSRKMESSDEKVTVCGSIDLLFEELSKYESDDVFVAGGEMVYSELLPYCTEAYVTKIDKAHEADTFFPDLDKSGDWEFAGSNGSGDYNGLRYEFVIYKNNNVKTFKLQ